MINIIKLFLLLTVSNESVNNQNSLEYTASINRGCPIDVEELESMIEGVLQSGNITPGL